MLIKKHTNESMRQKEVSNPYKMLPHDDENFKKDLTVHYKQLIAYQLAISG